MATSQKTLETNCNVADFINTAVGDDKKRADCFSLIELFKSQTHAEPKLWGDAIIGFGRYHYKYASGHEGDAPLVGFSPRKDAISLYFTCGDRDRELLLLQLGKHKAAKSCIYIKKLDDVNIEILKKLIDNSLKYIKNLYPDK